MTIKSLKELKEKYTAASEQNKASVIFGSENFSSAELIEFLASVATDPKVYDLARVEAIKSMGLAGLDIQERQQFVVKTLISIALTDEDDDIRSYALQSLCWYPTFEEILEAIHTLLLPSTESTVRDAAFSVALSQKNNIAAFNILQEFKNDPEFGKFISQELGSQRGQS